MTGAKIACFLIYIAVYLFKGITGHTPGESQGCGQRNNLVYTVDTLVVSISDRQAYEVKIIALKNQETSIFLVANMYIVMESAVFLLYPIRFHGIWRAIQQEMATCFECIVNDFGKLMSTFVSQFVG